MATGTFFPPNMHALYNIFLSWLGVNDLSTFGFLVILHLLFD